MKQYLNLKFLFPILAVFLLSSCEFKQPELRKVEEVTVISMQADRIEVEVKARVYNPNAVGFKVSSHELELYMNRKLLGKAKIKDSFKIKRNSEDSYTFRVVANPDPAALLTAELNTLLSGGKGSQIEVKGTLTGSAFGFKKKYPVSIQHRL